MFKNSALAFPPLANDALIPPRLPHGLEIPAGAERRDNSEFLHGRVGVVLIFPESNGSIDANEFNWTPALISNCVSEIQNGMSWWRSIAGDTGKLEFSFFLYDSGVNIGYEAIRRDMADENGDQSLVLTAILNALGQPTTPTPFEAMKYFNNTFRVNHSELDWVYIAIVVNDGGSPLTFPNSNHFAFAYIGGPFMVLTYSNDGCGINNMDVVSAHEMGHIFYALDEYAEAGMTANETSGYIPTRNENTLAGGGTWNEATCIMRSSTQPIDNNTACIYTRGQMGLTDTDVDFIPDILDLLPVANLTALPPSSTSNESFSIQGICFSESLPNNNPYGNRNNITINQIDTVQVRMDSGAWKSATPYDSFDTQFERFNYIVSDYSTGTHVIEIRGANRVGHDSTRIMYSPIKSYSFYSSYSLDTSIEPFFPAYGTCTNISAPIFKWRKWSRSSFSHYRLEFSDTSAFTAIAKTCTTTSSETSANVSLAMNRYYWRIIGVDTSGFSETSIAFLVWIDTAAPAKPVIILPGSDSSYSKRQPRCTFGEISDTGCGVVRYVVSHSNTPNFASDAEIISTETSYLIVLSDSGRYYIRFALEDSATNRSSWSDSVSILLGVVGDFNNDSKFDAEDLFDFALKYGSSATSLPVADLNENGVIDSYDVSVLLDDL